MSSSSSSLSPVESVSSATTTPTSPEASNKKGVEDSLAAACEKHDTDATPDHVPQRTTSKMKQSIDTYGTNSYYYAHVPRSEKYFENHPSDNVNVQIPEHAVNHNASSGPYTHTEPPRYVAGGSPIPLAVKERQDCTETKEIKEKIVLIEKYSWTEDEKWVKIYVDEADVMDTFKFKGEEALAAEFNDKSFKVFVRRDDHLVYLISVNIKETIKSDECEVKFTPKRLTIKLKKQTEEKWYSLKPEGRDW